ncbi:MAG: 30S ribosomal protein S6 [Flavobacteriales bacterium]|nr:30S ribosomal protein S6 [Flavobacteriales bacterium]MCX7768221.1 30S ribosomal protein S6 [Flavobacteriales bacterium]MDW8410141.1 30S ribosomal protein S6 [Flavobacteriales bacterium]
MRQYETVFIITPVLSEDQVREVTSRYKDLLLENGCKLIHEEKWGLRKLAYPVAKKTTGFYHLFEYQADPSFIEKFEINLKRDERILRFLTVKLDKHAIEYNARRRERLKEAKKEIATTQETTNA